MTEENFLTKPFNIDYVPYLDKSSVPEWTQVHILEVKKGITANRPLFIGEFIHGNFRFDFSVEWLVKFIEEFGNVPAEWIGVDIEVKAVQWKNKGLRLIFKP